MVDGQQGESTTNGDGGLANDLAKLLVAEEDQLGAVLMGQLDILIETWAKVIEALAQHGVDPTPLLQTLAGTLRATADQLDPTTRPKDA